MKLNKKVWGWLVAVLIPILLIVPLRRLSRGVATNQLVNVAENMPLPDADTMVQQLVDRGADVNARGKEGEPVLCSVAQYDIPEVVEVLLKAGANIEAHNVGGRTPLIIAARMRNKRVLALLIHHGANVNARAVNGQSALDFTRSIVYANGKMPLQNAAIAHQLEAAGARHSTKLGK